MNSMNPQHGSQRGAALVIALVFLIAITLLGLTSIRSSTMELRMAMNEETRITALEQAQAMIDLVKSDEDNLPVQTGVAGSTVNCYVVDNYTPPSNIPCTHATKTVNLDTETGQLDGNVYTLVTRLTPATSPAPRGLGMSGDKFDVALFGVVGGYDRSDEGLGASEIEQGLIKPLPKARGINN